MPRKKQNTTAFEETFNSTPAPNGSNSSLGDVSQGAATMLDTPPPTDNLTAQGRKTKNAAPRPPRSRKIETIQMDIVETKEPLAKAPATVGVVTLPTAETNQQLQQTEEQLRKIGQQSEETNRHLQGLRSEFAQIGEQAQTLKQQWLAQAQQEAEALRQQFNETREQVQTIQQLFTEAGRHLVVVFGQHLEQMKHHGEESSRQLQQARHEMDATQKQLQYLHAQTAEARQLFETCQHEGLEAKQKLHRLREEVQGARRELQEAQRAIHEPDTEARQLHETSQREVWEAEQKLRRLREEIQEAHRELQEAQRDLEVAQVELHTHRSEPSSATAPTTAANVVEEAKPRLGVIVDEVAVVAEVTSQTPAAHSGLQPGDVITRVNEQTILNAEELREAINKIPPGAEVKIEVVRGTETKEITTHLDELKKK